MPKDVTSKTIDPHKTGGVSKRGVRRQGERTGGNPDQGQYYSCAFFAAAILGVRTSRREKQRRVGDLALEDKLVTAVIDEMFRMTPPIFDGLDARENTKGTTVPQAVEYLFENGHDCPFNILYARSSFVTMFEGKEDFDLYNSIQETYERPCLVRVSMNGGNDFHIMYGERINQSGPLEIKCYNSQGRENREPIVTYNPEFELLEIYSIGCNFRYSTICSVPFGRAAKPYLQDLVEGLLGAHGDQLYTDRAYPDKWDDGRAFTDDVIRKTLERYDPAFKDRAKLKESGITFPRARVRTLTEGRRFSSALHQARIAWFQGQTHSEATGQKR